ncbi:tRNA dihydrouridine synthase [Martiniozyma asiatica (nom. inval.)]|nr:tRNA dihydrouridine synthase [Martiniozyma asiatica]
MSTISNKENKIPESINLLKGKAIYDFENDKINLEKSIREGRALFESLGSPKKIVAPMVDGSELGWRIMSRRYGAELCYSPMIHSRLFVEDRKYREQFICPQDGQRGLDRPLIIQFCANDPDILLQAAKHVVGKCDAVDINFGCPQGIAKKGHYGSFLMDEWNLVYSLINKLAVELGDELPVTAKIRVFDDWAKSLEYAKMCLRAGAKFLTVHGRTREMKGQKTGLANWKLVNYLRSNLPEGVVFISNGNILYPDDINRCIENIGCDAVMSAESNLCNPGVFWTKNDDIDRMFPRVDKFMREYFDVVKECGGVESKRCMKTHIFKALRVFLPIHTDIRTQISQLTKNSTMEEVEKVIIAIEKAVEEIYQKPDIKELDVIKVGEVQEWGGKYREVPYWRLQPAFRKVDGKDGKDVIKSALVEMNSKNEEQEKLLASKKRANDEPLVDAPVSKSAKN